MGLGLINPPIATTAIPLGFTTTRRPPNGSPRVKSNLRNKQHRPEEEERGHHGTEQTPRKSPFDNPPFISADGRKPRVKANINNQRIISGNSQNKGKAKKQGSKKVELDRSQFSKIDFVEPSAPHADARPTAGEGGFAGPEVRPDGRLPRVKANVRAKERQQGGHGITPLPPLQGTPTPRNIFSSPRPQGFAGTATPRNRFTSPQPSGGFRGTANPGGFRGSPTPRNRFTSPQPSGGFRGTANPGNSFSSPSSGGFRGTPNPRDRFTSPRPFIPQPTPAVPDFNPNGNTFTSPKSFVGKPTPAVPNERPFSPKSSFIPQPTPAVPPSSFSPVPPPQNRPSRPLPTNQFNPGSPIRQGGSRDPPQEQPRFSVRPQSRQPAPGIRQSFPSPTPRPFTATPQPAVPTATHSSANKFSFLTTVASRQPTSSPSFSFTSPAGQQSFGPSSARPSGPALAGTAGPPPFNHRPSQRPGGGGIPSLQRNRNRFGSRPSGRPRVKANELAAQSQGGENQRGSFRESPRFKTGGSRRQQPPQGIKFKTIVEVNNEIEEEKGKCHNPFLCPPSKTAGGRRPRVKSNIKARKRNFWNPRKSRVIKRRKQVKLNRKLWENVRRGRKQSVADDASSAPLDNSIDNEPIRASVPLDIRADVGGSTTPDPISSLQQLVAKSKQATTPSPETFPPARRFQNKRIQPKQRQRIIGRSRSRSRQGRFSTIPTPEETTVVTTVAPIASPPTESPQSVASLAPRRINAPTGSLAPGRRRPPEVEALIRKFGPPQLEKPRDRPKGPPSFANLGPPPQPKIPPEVAALLKRFGPPRNRHRTTRRPETTTTVSLFVTNPNFQPETATESPAPPPLPASSPTQNVPQSPFTASDMGLFVTNPRALPDHHKASRNPFREPPERSPDGRRPRVKSNIMASLQNRPGPTAGPPAVVQPKEQTTKKTVPVLRINPDGRSPRVKSNQRNKKNQNKKKKTFRNLRKQFQRERSGRSQDIDGEEANSVVDSDSDESDDYVEPELRPDGKKPRIKSNLKAKQQMGKGQSGKQKKSGFRHSKRVALNHSSRGPFQATTLADGSPGEDADETDIAITTFRPTISLEEFNPGETNETFPVPATKLSVPLPNFDKERFSEAVFQPTPRGFTRNEPAFSEKAAVNSGSKLKMEVAVETATEIVRVSSKDQNLFDSDYNYEDYYYDQINSEAS